MLSHAWNFLPNHQAFWVLFGHYLSLGTVARDVTQNYVHITKVNNYTPIFWVLWLPVVNDLFVWLVVVTENCIGNDFWFNFFLAILRAQWIYIRASNQHGKPRNKFTAEQWEEKIKRVGRCQVSAWQSETLLPIICKSAVPDRVEEPASQVK